MKQPFLNYILNGKKTIESRATKVKCAPYGKVHENDTIYFRESGDFVVIAKARVDAVGYSHNIIQTVSILRTYAKEICITEDYINSKKDSRFLTLIWLKDIEKILPFPFVKHDRRAWITNFTISKKVNKSLKTSFKETRLSY